MILAFAAALALQGAPAHTPDDGQWEPLARDEWGEYLIDPESVERSGRRIRFRLRMIPVQPLDDGTALLVSGQEVDCAAGTMTTTDADLYRPDGSLIRSTPIPESAQVAEPIADGSAQDTARRALCGGGGGK